MSEEKVPRKKNIIHLKSIIFKFNILFLIIMPFLPQIRNYLLQKKPSLFPVFCSAIRKKKLQKLLLFFQLKIQEVNIVCTQKENSTAINFDFCVSNNTNSLVNIKYFQYIIFVKKKHKKIILKRGFIFLNKSIPHNTKEHILINIECLQKNKYNINNIFIQYRFLNNV